MQRPWTIYDLDAADNTPTEETLNLLKFWAQYTSGVLMMDPLDMMLQYPPSQAEVHPYKTCERVRRNASVRGQ